MRVRVDINFEQNTSVISATTTAQGANVSKDILTAAGGYAGFQLSEQVDRPASILDGRAKFFDPVEGYPGWISKQLSNEDATFAEPIKWSLVFSNKTRYVFIHFDEELYEYATKIQVTSNGVTDIVYNNSVVCIIAINNAAECTIEILEWSKPNKSAKITLFDVSDVLSLKGSYIESLECSEQAWNGSFTLSTGFMQQYADITFRDYNGVLQSLADVGGLIKFLPVRIYVYYKGVWNYLGQYFTDKWSVDKVDDIVSVTCNDLTRNFADTVKDVIGENLTVMQLFDQLGVNIFPSEDSYVVDPFTGEDISFADFMARCVSKDTYFQKVAVDQIINQLCDRWMLRIYWQAYRERYVVMEAW